MTERPPPRRAVQPSRPGLPGPIADPAAGSPVAGVPLVNPANALTVLRLLLVPVVLVLVSVDGGHEFAWRIGAGVVFGIASVTDRLDGELARRKNLITSFGKMADPIADKALTGSALVALSVGHDLPWWVTGVVLGRELAVTALRFFVIRHGVIPASRGGKLKTLLQALAIGLYLLPLGAGPMGTIRAVLLALAVVVTMVTGLDYIGRAVRLRRSSPRTARARDQREAAEAAIAAQAARLRERRRAVTPGGSAGGQPRRGSSPLGGAPTGPPSFGTAPSGPPSFGAAPSGPPSFGAAPVGSPPAGGRDQPRP